MQYILTYRTYTGMLIQVKEVLIQTTECKVGYKNQYTIFRKLLSADNKNIPLCKIVNCINKVVVDYDKKIVIE